MIMGSLTGKLPPAKAKRAIDLPYHDEYDTTYYGEIGSLYSDEEEDIEQPYSVSHRLGTLIFPFCFYPHHSPLSGRATKKRTFLVINTSKSITLNCIYATVCCVFFRNSVLARTIFASPPGRY